MHTASENNHGCRNSNIHHGFEVGIAKSARYFQSSVFCRRVFLFNCVDTLATLVWCAEVLKSYYQVFSETYFVFTFKTTQACLRRVIVRSDMYSLQKQLFLKHAELCVSRRRVCDIRGNVFISTWFQKLSQQATVFIY